MKLFQTVALAAMLAGVMGLAAPNMRRHVDDMEIRAAESFKRGEGHTVNPKIVEVS